MKHYLALAVLAMAGASGQVVSHRYLFAGREFSTGPERRALIAALYKISGQMQQIPQRDLRAASGELAAFYIFPPKAKATVANLFSTHPSLDARVAALQRYEAQLQGTAR